ncbi:MAG: B12-binding domain-containing radical SAM protein [Rickettsiales bacterium]|jgi:radical SAM superfamily enzyme YgiQ (UPF0313 family)|nr:B12-binding domain-containing radical SAM protein [Rickettsiales bacterium]
MKSILLINPQNSSKIRSPGYFLMPLSLLYLSGASRSVASTHILDLNVAKKKFFQQGEIGEFSYIEVVKKEVERLKPDFVGITCLFSEQFDMVLNIAGVVKKKFPSSIVILGGMHPTIFYYDILSNCQSVDAVVIGEGERTLENLLTLDMTKWKSIDGFAFRNQQKQIIVNPKTSFVENLDSLPPPAYDLFNFDDYRLDSSGWYNPKKINIGTSAPVLTSRSCPAKCGFCGMRLVMGASFRARSAEVIFKEIEYLYKEHNVRYFNIMDDNFTFDKKRIKQICSYIIDARLDISFDMPNGIMTTTLDDDVIDALAEAGFAYCFLAIESGSDYIRNKVMHKRLSLDTIFRVVNSFRRHPQIHLAAFFLMGMPEETRETLDETCELINKLDIDSFKMSVATPFPGTSLFKQCLRDKLFLVDDARLKSLWKDTSWYQRILNVDPPFFFKPYKMEIAELEEYAKKFEEQRHLKHLITYKNGRQTLSVTQAIADYRKRNPGAP